MQKKILFLAATTALVSANAQVKLTVDGHEAVDLGTSVLWATYNVGATAPEEAGDYFYFGLTEKAIKWEKVQIPEKYLNDEVTELAPEDDAATVNFGANWHTPTLADFQELLEKCDLEYVLNESDEKIGCWVKRKTNENKIYLPLPGAFFTQWTFYMSKTANEGLGTYNSDKVLENSFASSLFGEANIRAVCAKPSYSSLKSTSAEKQTVTQTIENGQIVIIKNGVKFNLAGQKL